jgi:two-component system, NtrC family, sensor kinase
MNPVPPFLVALFLIPFAQKFLRLSEQLPVWHERLRIGRIVIFVACGIEMLTDGNYISPLVFFLSILLVAAPAYLLKEKLSNARLLLWTIAPATVVLLIDNLFEFWTPKFYKANEYGFDGIVVLSLIVSTVLGFVARKQQKAFDQALKEQEIKLQIEEENNKVLEAKKLDLEYQVRVRTTELTKQKEALERALAELKTTQAQLIQSEKLASLGELTAGIAHEIQNPLNFVTNFSELSVELIQELGPPAPEGGVPDSPIGGWGAFFMDITQNLEKINYHGKRASSIVKAMLEHSRTNTGIKELTDINKLADEYLRLSYHGMRAKDTRFNSNYELIAEPYLPLINVVPQDIGRVLLNLINNAFQAVVETLHATSLHAASLPKYQPIVRITTQYIDSHIVIKVQDNGSGMSEAVKAKIFQPFFTTKPSGEGTGLGLSLSYDIITKGHGGTIDVESTEGVGTTFTVKLPVY